MAFRVFRVQKWNVWPAINPLAGIPFKALQLNTSL